MKRLKDKARPLVERWINNRCKRFSPKSLIAHIEVGNFLVSLSTTGLMALGVVPMSLNVLIALAILLVIIGVVGRYIDSVQDDMERLKKYEQHLSQSASGSVPNNAGCDGLQSPNNKSEEQ